MLPPPPRLRYCRCHAALLSATPLRQMFRRRHAAHAILFQPPRYAAFFRHATMLLITRYTLDTRYAFTLRLLYDMRYAADTPYAMPLFFMP